MDLRLMGKIKEDKNKLIYLRNNPKWYIYLNRDPKSYKDFERSFKYDYNMYRINKISNTLSTIEMLEKLFINNK